MNYEKAYKDAIEKARAFYETKSPDCLILESIFPELRESDDEIIRKEILNVVKQLDEGTTICGENYDYNKWIAWLEKQHKNKHVTDFSNIKTWKLIVDAILTKEHGIGQYLDDARTVTWAKELLERFGNIKQKYGLEKQSEQNKKYLDIIISLWNLLDKIDTFADLKIDDTNIDNPFRKITHITQERHNFVKSDGYNLFIDDKQITNQTYTKHDTIEPKFKAGDWITNGEVTWKIDKVFDTNYTDTAGAAHNIERTDANFHIWSIEDAKDGDILSQDNIPFIFKSWDNNCIAYCGITDSGLFVIVEDNLSWCNGINVVPATKEQRVLLFQKMHAAGFEWNAKTKELTKKL